MYSVPSWPVRVRNSRVRPSLWFTVAGGSVIAGRVAYVAIAGVLILMHVWIGSGVAYGYHSWLRVGGGRARSVAVGVAVGVIVCV